MAKGKKMADFFRRTAHFVMNGKGGVGKSMTAINLVQYLIAKGLVVSPVDLDQINPTLDNFKALGAKKFRLLKDDNITINQREFDNFAEYICSTETNFVVDNGSNTFLQLLGYCVENQLWATLMNDFNCDVYVHSVVAGGSNWKDTCLGVESICSYLPAGVKFVVWCNEYYGGVEKVLEGEVDEMGRPKKIIVPVLDSFEESPLYCDLVKDDKDETKKFTGRNIHGIVTLKSVTTDTLGVDLQTMYGANQTYDEAFNNPALNFMAKTRLKRYFADICEQLDYVLVAPEQAPVETPSE